MTQDDTAKDHSNALIHNPNSVTLGFVIYFGFNLTTLPYIVGGRKQAYNHVSRNLKGLSLARPCNPQKKAPASRQTIHGPVVYCISYTVYTALQPTQNQNKHSQTT